MLPKKTYQRVVLCVGILLLISSYAKETTMKQTQTQNDLIKAHLEEGKAITAYEALELYGCLRLAARIAELRKSGMNIITNRARRNGKEFGSYTLVA